MSKIKIETADATAKIPAYIDDVNRVIADAKNYEHTNVNYDILEWSATPTTILSDIIEPVLVSYLTAVGYKVYPTDYSQEVKDDYPDVPNGKYYWRTLDIRW